MNFYIREITQQNDLIVQINFGEYDNIHRVYCKAYEMAQMSNNKIEIWQRDLDKNQCLCIIIRSAIPPTDSKKKYDPRTGISFTSEI
jgi:hypothetical protein